MPRSGPWPNKMGMGLSSSLGETPRLAGCSGVCVCDSIDGIISIPSTVKNQRNKHARGPFDSGGQNTDATLSRRHGGVTRGGGHAELHSGASLLTHPYSTTTNTPGQKHHISVLTCVPLGCVWRLSQPTRWRRGRRLTERRVRRDPS